MVGMNGLSNGQPREKTLTKIQVKIAQLILSPLQKKRAIPLCEESPGFFYYSARIAISWGIQVLA